MTCSFATIKSYPPSEKQLIRSINSVSVVPEPPITTFPPPGPPFVEPIFFPPTPVYNPFLSVVATLRKANDSEFLSVPLYSSRTTANGGPINYLGEGFSQFDSQKSFVIRCFLRNIKFSNTIVLRFTSTDVPSPDIRNQDVFTLSNNYVTVAPPQAFELVPSTFDYAKLMQRFNFTLLTMDGDGSTDNYNLSAESVDPSEPSQLLVQFSLQ